MTKTERISDLRRAAERLGSRASTVRGIAAALRGHCALGHFGYGVRPIRRTSRAAYYRAAHQERADRYFGTKAEGACIAARLIPRDERCTLDRLGVGTYGRTCYARAEALEARSLAARALQRRHADVRDAATVFVDVADSVRGGNCQQGTEQYARQLWDRLGASGPCAIRGDIILRDRDDVFARRALGAATQRA